MKNTLLTFGLLGILATTSSTSFANELANQKPALKVEIESMLELNMTQVGQTKITDAQVQLAKIRFESRVPSLSATLKDKVELAKGQKLSD